MKSQTLPIYKTWLKTATASQITFVDSVYTLCEENYDKGGDVVCECLGPKEILGQFTSNADVREYCGLQVEQALNARWGEDSDPELARAEQSEAWLRSRRWPMGVPKADRVN